MSTVPSINQTRRTLRLADGSVKFEVTTVVTDSGDLPFRELFVMTVDTAQDAKDDIFARVVTPFDIRQADSASPKFIKVSATDLLQIPPDLFARIPSTDDLTVLQRDRTWAIQLGQSEYLTSVMTTQYDTLTTADAAYKQIISRLSTLVTDWRSAYSAFITAPSQNYTLPQVNASVQAQAAGAYVSARTARQAAETARDAAQTAYNACVTDCAPARAVYAFLAADVTFLETARAVVSAIVEVATPNTATTTTYAQNFVLAASTYAGDSRSYQVLLNQKRAQLADYAARVTACDVECNTLQTALLNAQAAVAAAQTAERNALANAYAVCPTFDPTSV